MIYIDILVKWRKFIIANTLVIAVFSIILSLMLPKWYKGTATIMSPKEQGILNLFAGGSSVLRGLSALPKIGGFGQNPGAYNYFAILKSRTIMEDVIRKFNLFEVYNISDSSMEDCVKSLRENVAFEYQDDDYITIDVYDKDPIRASAMANYFIAVLNETSIRLATREAHSNREFIERRLNDARENLKKAEETLVKQQEQKGIIISPEQTGAISAIAELYSMKAKKEIEIAIIQRNLGKDNEILNQKLIELGEMEKKLSTFPQIGLESYRLYRDVAIGQKILEVLIPLYEQSKIDEQKDVPVLLVLDKAVPPTRKAKPQRSLIVFSTTMITLFLSILLSFWMHAIFLKNKIENLTENRLKGFVNRIIALYKIKISL
ncbi:MAG: hypothetical protein HZB59_03005 [Ignavibacteriales bacterium]|nr:hypothetical protein [Ignavibacteriales bacterium]